MTPQELSDAYARVARNHELRPMVPARCRIETRALTSSEHLIDALLGYQPRQGWLQFQSRIVAFDDGNLPRPSPEWGVLLDGETVDTEGRSIHVRHLGSGEWKLVVCRPTDETDPTAETDLLLADEVRQLATDKAPGTLRYRRYWRMSTDDRNNTCTGPVPAFAAFIGFASKEDH